MICSLDAVVMADPEEVSRCAHPAVLGILKDVLLGSAADPAQASARLLEQLLVRSREARQIFLSRESGGAEALLAASRGVCGGVAATAAQRVLETLIMLEAN